MAICLVTESLRTFGIQRFFPEEQEKYIYIYIFTCIFNIWVGGRRLAIGTLSLRWRSIFFASSKSTTYVLYTPHYVCTYVHTNSLAQHGKYIGGPVSPIQLCSNC